VCQVLEGHAAPIFCRAADLAPDAERSVEREANVFEAELMMPEPLVEAEWGRKSSPTELASMFGVWRLYNFGLVDERP